MATILLIVLILLLIGLLPKWPYSSRWGYYPSGGLGLVLPYPDCLDVHRPGLSAVQRGPLPRGDRERG